MIVLCEMILLVYLLIMTGFDVTKGRISLCLSLISAGGLVLLRIQEVCENEMSFGVMFSGIYIGVILLILSKLSRGGIGAGDGIVFVVTGLVYGIWENAVLLLIALTLSGVVGGILLILHKVGRKALIPFVPFVSVGYGVMFIWKYIIG